MGIVKGSQEASAVPAGVSGAEPAPWGPAHRREATRRTYELAAERVGIRLRLGGRDADDLLVGGLPEHTRDAEAWGTLLIVAGFTDARIAREVRRVRDLAEGRSWRVTGERWHVRLVDAKGTHTSTEDSESETRRVVAAVNNPAVKATVLHVRVRRLLRVPRGA